MLTQVIILIALISFCIGCGNSPTKEELRQNIKNPDLENMVLIPAGEFVMGSKEGEGAFDEHPQHKVYLDAYYIDKYEVTNAQFKEFVEETRYITDAERKGEGEVWNPKIHGRLRRTLTRDVDWKNPHGWSTEWNRPHPEAWENYQLSDRRNYPVVQVSYNDAKEYAKWSGKRLPTEAEWEKAAKGTKGRIYPWGDEFNSERAINIPYTNMNSEESEAVGQFPIDVSPYGIYDMAGNVREWVVDWYEPYYYINSPFKNPVGPNTGEFRVLRGGSWIDLVTDNLRSASRMRQTPDYSSNYVGFRCVWSP